MESLSNFPSESGFITAAYISTALNLTVKSLLVLGAIAVFPRLSNFTRFCLLTGSILLFLSNIATSAIAHIFLIRVFSPAQYGLFVTVTGFISSCGFLMFAIGFYQLSQKFVRLKLHLSRE